MKQQHNASAYGGSLNNSGMMMQKPLQSHSLLSGLNRSMNESIIDEEDVFDEFHTSDHIRSVFISTPLQSPYNSTRDVEWYSFHD